jgi:hypothetical protein
MRTRCGGSEGGASAAADSVRSWVDLAKRTGGVGATVERAMGGWGIWESGNLV